MLVLIVSLAGAVARLVTWIVLSSALDKQCSKHASLCLHPLWGCNASAAAHHSNEKEMAAAQASRIVMHA